MKIYLYKKTHRITGLKYLGKTVAEDPHLYKGSGTHWKAHINKHGYDVETEILRECESHEELKKWGLYYSELWNVVESNEWANLRPEEGDGGDTSDTENHKLWAEEASKLYKRRRWWNNGVDSVFSESPPNHTYVHGRGPFNNAGAQLGGNVQREKHWVNDGSTEVMIDKSSSIPFGFSMGRLSSPKKGRPNTSAKGRKWWNNGAESRMKKESPGPEWKPGRISRKK